MGKPQPYDSNYKLTSPFHLLSEAGDYIDGYIVDGVYGIVLIDCRKGENPYSRFRFAYAGVFYLKVIEQSYSKRYLVTLAKRFAEEIIQRK